MSIFVILISMAGGAAISEMYHRRMWNRYQQGKREGRAYNTEDSRYSDSPKSRITVMR